MSQIDNDQGILKTTPIIRDLFLNPSCGHGPTILFERDGRRYFSCSAYRSRKLCPFYLPEENWIEGPKKRSREELGVTSITKSDKKETNNPISYPNQSDKGEAQYHFNEKTVEFFLEQFKELKVDRVLCIGTPSLHEEIVKRKGKLKSFLLDIDERFDGSYEDFALYNMCNHHFFRDSTKYKEFLSKSKRLALIMDPPFGVKVELLWHGCINGVKDDLSKVRKQQGKSFGKDICDMKVFWIFPYFMEGHILNKCPESGFKMSDFHVEYRNHAKYSGGSKSKSSPIRLFTNVPLSELPLPEGDYRYCDTCEKWVDKQNLHCDMCTTCPTKDGGKTYIHCFHCEKCVKPTWKHCPRCKLCHLNEASVCKSDQSSQNQLNNFKTDSKRQKKDYQNKVIQLKKKNPVSVNIKKKSKPFNTQRIHQRKRTNK